MTKWFTYFGDKTSWTEDEFFNYFEDKEHVFGSWLRTSYEMSVHGESVWKIVAVVHDFKAKFSITLNNGYEYPAGEEVCMCPTELWNGFVDRIYDPDKYIRAS